MSKSVAITSELAQASPELQAYVAKLEADQAELDANRKTIDREKERRNMPEGELDQTMFQIMINLALNDEALKHRIFVALS